MNPFFLFTTFCLLLFQQHTFVQKNNCCASIESTVNEGLDILTGDTTKVRDWNRFRNLFLPTAQIIIRNHNKRNPRAVNVLNLEEFIRYAGPQYQRNGFEERQIEMKYDEYNGTAQAFQTFYARDHKTGYEERGVNAYQLVYAQGRWWVASLMFTSDRNGVEIPKLN